MKFLRDWLRIERPAGVAPNAAQRVEIAAPFPQAWRTCLRGIEDVLGGTVREADERRGTIEATFGLVNSERLTCSLRKESETVTEVLIQSRRGATVQPAKPSQYVRALAEFLQTGAR
ncbi:MAG TPA: hypothetical protein VIO32_00650 [Candidatus Baltobacteraceae bacterium]